MNLVLRICLLLDKVATFRQFERHFPHSATPQLPFLNPEWNDNPECDFYFVFFKRKKNH